jgi:hypothetical protein
LTKSYEDKSLDADIHLDWQKRTVKFENSVKLWNKRYLRNLFLVALFLGLVAFSLFSLTDRLVLQEMEAYQKNPDAWKPNFQPISFYAQVAMSVSVFVFVCAGTLLHNYVLSHPKFRGTLFKIKTKAHPHVYVISNPSGTIKIDLHGSNPLVDLEFPESISKSLLSASMVKVQLSKHYSRKQMVIVMRELAVGTLIIKEY